LPTGRWQIVKYFVIIVYNYGNMRVWIMVFLVAWNARAPLTPPAIGCLWFFGTPQGDLYPPIPRQNPLPILAVYFW